MLLTLLISLTTLFLVPFVLTSSVLCVHHAFRTADIHEVLPPLLSPVVVVAMSVLQAIDGPRSTPRTACGSSSSRARRCP
ncbi:hypothetical protein ACIGD1_18140 [Streptomyces sp. NPDC085612]|uniref:hypothetical protein n=1 Tax=Streptomyces sp. NPDC085612 TaxID=3365732 RepID=UPI0037D14D96